QAALAGRDIYLLQKCSESLFIRSVIEEILVRYDGPDHEMLENVRRYAKLFWVNNGPYNAYTTRKNVMAGTPARLLALAEGAAAKGAKFRHDKSAATIVKQLEPILFD